MVFQRIPPPQSKDVLYIGSAVPLETSEGLEAVQQPLSTRYPLDGEENIRGIMATLTVLPDGLQLQYKHEPSHVILFPYKGFSLCAAVRCVKTYNASTNQISARFVSVTSAESLADQSDKPTIFTAITRRTKGRQVLECHGFITASQDDAIALVQWTSTADMRAKKGLAPVMSRESTLGAFRGDAFRSDAFRSDASFSDVRSLPPEMGEPGGLVGGEIPGSAEPPASGHFYCDNSSNLVKTYSLKKFVASSPPPLSPAMAAQHHDFDTLASASAAHDNFDRRSFVSMPASRPPPMMSRTMLRGPPAHMRRAILVPGPAPPPPMVYARPRMFMSPPPPQPILVPQPVPQPIPVMIPQAHPGMYGDFATLRPHRDRRGSKGSSRSSSRSSVEIVEANGRPKAREDSSDYSSRPRTPPTDYDPNTRRTRMSRKDDFRFRRGQSVERKGMTLTSPMRGPAIPPPGYIMMPVTLPRSKSVPPQGRLPKKEKKSKKKKSKKSKKGKKQADDYPPGPLFIPVHSSASFRSNGEPGTDLDEVKLNGSSPYNDANPYGPAPHRAFSRSAAEKAFSRSLRDDTRGQADIDPYSINYNPGIPDNVFPLY